MVKNRLMSKVAPASSRSDYPSSVGSSARKMTTQEILRENRYRAESDLRTITEAQSIMRDRARMACVKQVAREQMKSLSSVTGKKK